MQVWIVILSFVHVEGLKDIAKVWVMADSSKAAIGKARAADFNLGRELFSSPIAYAPSRDADGIIGLDWKDRVEKGRKG
jgi:hypothetical protein